MDGLRDRVEKFQTLSLPGQPMGMRMGTLTLVNDLWREVARLRELVKISPDDVSSTPVPSDQRGCEK